MPKCEKCQYLVRTNYEYGEYECEIFGDYDSGKMFTENGCRYTQKQLKAKYDKNYKMLSEYYDGYAEWYKKRCNTKETCVICGKETTGDNTFICDSNHNTVDEPCGQIVCFQCWEEQRRDSIYDGKVPDCCVKFRARKAEKGEGK